ncbi:THAP domain-containing protein 1 isoform X1 [Tachysurus vachellii]|uniref:THAP domain-containing protein 1 isoform X1 n=2 Tax=Tachysurus vachellii TaxID=175792 RepID=UPI00296AFB0D|nr:THAP domain-containing protein 1 isoform X1 [Tachysurus vachellii]
MVQSCSAYGCKNRYHKDKDVSFHKFPLARPDLCGKWVVAMKRRNFKPTKYSNICSQHFTKDCFKRECNNRVLKENAVPSLFNFTKLQIKAQSPEEAITPNLSFSLLPPSTHTPEPDVLQTPHPQASSPTSSSSVPAPAPSPSAPLKEEDPLRACAFISCDHNYTVDDMVQQKKRVEQLVEQLTKLRRKLKTLRQKCRRQERQLERFRAMEEISKSGNNLELGQSYILLPRELLSTTKDIHTTEGL